MKNTDDLGAKEALLQAIKAEQRRRQQVDVGEVTPISVVVTGIPSDNDEPVEDDPDAPITCVVTGVPRAGDPISEYELRLAVKPNADEGRGISSFAPERALGEEPVAVSPPQSARTPPRYVRVTLQRSRDGFPGRIAEGAFEVRGDNVVLTDMEGEIIGGRQLLQGEDPSFVARELLRQRQAGDEFSEPIHYPTSHLA
jgi:hypothetical protein